MADWRQAARDQLARQQAAAEQRSKDIEERKKQEEAARRARLVKGFDLSPEEESQLTSSTSETAPILSGPSPLERETPVPGQIPEKEKQTGVQPVPPSGGVSPTEPPAQVKPTPSADKEQAKKADTIESTLGEIGAIQAAFGANKEPDRKELTRLLNALEAVKPDTTNIKDPITRNFLQDKAEAYRAYREKADRNDWLEIAQNLVNSLTQFASTQAAQGTRFVGGNLPLPTTDYGAKTGRALQEYKLQAEDISGEQKAAESAQERVDRLRKEEMAGKRAGLGERIAAERERIRQEESDAKQAGRDAISLYGTLQSNKRAVEQNETAIQKAILQHEQRKDQASEKLVDNQIGYLASQETQLKKQLDAANELIGSDKKNYEKKLADWAASAGQNAAGVVDKAQKESGFFTSNKDYVQETLAPQHAQMVQEQLATIGKQLGELRAAKYGTPKGAAPTPTTPSTTPAAGGMVDMVAPDGRTLKVPSDKVAELEAKGAKRK